MDHRRADWTGVDETARGDLPRVLAVLRRQLPLIIAFALVAGGIALAVSLAQTKRYEARATMLFQRDSFDDQLFSDSSSSFRDPSREAATNQGLVAQPVVAQRAARRLGQLDAGTVAATISIEADEESDLVSIRAEDTDPERAALIANVYSEEYIGFRRDAARAKTRDAQQLIDRELRGLDPRELRSPEGRRLRERSNELKILASLQSGDAELVQRALVPGAPSSPRPKLNTAAGLALGLILGIVVALLLDRLDRRIKDDDDPEEIFRRPLIAAIPRDSKTPKGQHAVLAEPSALEAFRMMRANLRYFNVDEPLTVVMVTSPSPEDGKTTVSWNLAAVAAVGGASVLLIESDMREPEMAARWGVPPGGGLCEALTSNMSLAEAVSTVSLNGSSPSRTRLDSDGETRFDVLVAGGLPPDPSEMLDSASMRALIATAREHYDLVVIDTPPLRLVPDAIPLISAVDGVLIVIRANKTTRDDAEQLRDQLEKLNAPITGIVFNGLKQTGDPYGYGYYARPHSEREPVES